MIRMIKPTLKLRQPARFLAKIVRYCNHLQYGGKGHITVAGGILSYCIILV
jgi:hypothetical protein